MVEFEPEENRFTSGDGTFQLDYLDRDDIVIDPLPHNREYFESHLEFARNYFERVSNGNLEVEYEVLPEVVRVDGVMADYAPIGEDDDENFKLAELARDAWSEVAETGQADLSGYDADNTMFIVFHAGAGRDLELLGTTLDKTPQDIPSVYLGEDALSRLLDDPQFDGFAVDDSGTRIKNTAILPQTQSRAGEDIEQQEFVLELSINGILTANVGSFIGLPDLFNTDTGESGIGRFGLMDGASIFSYRGMFPPEPSAWEKKYLGWLEADDIDLHDEDEWDLPAVSLREDRSLKRYNISSDEYFLLENRHRDPQSDGVTVTVRTPDGELVDHHFDNEEERFDPFDDSDYDEILEPGVVVDVSNFDWSLPGGIDIVEEDDVDVAEGRELNGGILIWQIDESVIRRKIDDNEVNADSERRGVNLIEADGAQDIGRPISDTDDSRFLQGHAFDFWWEGNDFTVITQQRDSIVVYENRFGPDTQPKAKTASGSPVPIEFYDFSDNIPNASFRLRSAQSDLYTRNRLDADLGDIETITSDDRAHTWPLSLDAYTIDADTSLIIPGKNGLRTVTYSNDQPQVQDINLPNSNQPLLTDNELITSTYGEEPPNKISGWIFQNSEWTPTYSVEDDFPIPALISKEPDRPELFIDGTNIIFDEDEQATLGDRDVQRSAQLNGIQLETNGSQIFLPEQNTINLSPDYRESERIYVGGLRETQPGFFLMTDYNLDRINLAEGELESWIRDTEFNQPALVDFNEDGNIDALYVDRDRNKLNARNQKGATLDNFPVSAPKDYQFVGTPLIADITGNNSKELLLTVQDEYSIEIIAYDNNLRRIRDEFPLFVGAVNDKEDVPVHPVFFDNTLLAISHHGDITTWTFSDAGEIMWRGPYGEFDLNKIVSHQTSGEQAEPHASLLNNDETYNWPNPADDHTHIRFETSQSARVSVQIANMSGTVVYEDDFESSGGMPEDIQINTSSWGSGVYFGKVEARNGGNRESKMIKIVVQH